MQISSIKISQIKGNPNNPRIIKDKKFEKLCQSIRELPQMLNIRPIIVNQDMVILGGNMRFKAAKHIGMKILPVAIYTEQDHLETDSYKKFNRTYEESCQEIVIKDNVSFGEWDWDVLGNEWDGTNLGDWGLDVWQPEEEYVPKDFKDISDKITDVFKIEIELDSENELEMMYNELTKTGYKCRILTF